MLHRKSACSMSIGKLMGVPECDKISIADYKRGLYSVLSQFIFLNMNKSLIFTCTYVHITSLRNSELDSFAWSMVIPHQSHINSAAWVLNDIPIYSSPAPDFNSGLIVVRVVSLQVTCFQQLCSSALNEREV